MTREEAMYLLNNLRSVAEGKEDEAIDMAIEALSADAVPQRKWLRKEYGNIVLYACSKCGHASEFRYAYCPNCGAKMGGGNND